MIERIEKKRVSDDAVRQFLARAHARGRKDRTLANITGKGRNFGACVMPNCYAFRVCLHKPFIISSAEGVRFELTRPFGLPVFKTGAINRSATPP
jgi:hypothetical protein